MKEIPPEGRRRKRAKKYNFDDIVMSVGMDEDEKEEFGSHE
jgi:hypothetical protein